MIKYDVAKAIIRHQVKVYKFFQGWRCTSINFSDIGLTRNEAIDAWVEDVAHRGSPGAFNRYYATKIAKRLKQNKS